VKRLGRAHRGNVRFDEGRAAPALNNECSGISLANNHVLACNNADNPPWPGAELGPLGTMMSSGYFFSVLLRRLAYSTGLVSPAKLPVPVISVGSLTVGGSGKTVCVELLARWCVELGEKPAMVSRGYGAFRTKDGRFVQDEALVLGENLPGIPVYMDPNRVRAGASAIARGASCIILDDAFSHFAISRDLDIVLVDATSPLEGRHLLPRGPLREPLAWLNRADFVVLTRVDQAASAALEAQRSLVNRLAPRAQKAESVHEPFRLTRLGDGKAHDVEYLRNKRVLLVSALGNPAAFEATAAHAGAEVLGHVVFRDHHRFKPPDLERIHGESTAAGADFVLCTQKDAVKLKLLKLGALELFSLDVRMRLVDGEDRLRRCVADALGK